MGGRIIVSGTIASHPLYGAGNTWAFLQYVLGFRRLGFETYYIENIKPTDCFDENWKLTPFAKSANAQYFRAVMDRFDLSEHSALLELNGPGHVGLTHDQVERLAPNIDLLVNPSGCMRLKSVLSAVSRRMYIDLDPGYTQIWQEQYAVDVNLPGHDVYVTVGLNMGKPDCPLPTGGVHWETTLPPVFLGEWTLSSPPGIAYSTIADWRGYGPVEWRGVWYGQKAEEFLRVSELPARICIPLEICLAIDPSEPGKAILEQHGWHLPSPLHHAITPDAYRDYIFSSRGEFTVVKHGYALGRTGWFSDRSACYLAAERPVIIQDTGIGRYVPTGMGLLTFTNIDEAAEGLARVERDYARHAAAARDFAQEFLDSDRILSRLWQLAGY